MAKTKSKRCGYPKDDGTPCGAWRMKGKNTCVGHLDRKEKEAIGFGGPQEGSGRPKNPRVIDTLRDKVEERADEIMDVYFDAMKATRAIVVGSGADAFVDEVPDWPTRLRAVEALNDRAYGKPKQVSEISGPEGGPIEHVGIPDEDDFHFAAAQLLAEAGAITEEAAT